MPGFSSSICKFEYQINTRVARQGSYLFYTKQHYIVIIESFDKMDALLLFEAYKI